MYILNFCRGDAKSKINPESKLKSLMETFFNDIQIIIKNIQLIQSNQQ